MPILNVFPLIRVFDARRSSINAQNNLFRIRLWNRAPRPAAVLAQEVFELGYKWRRFGAYLFSAVSKPRRRAFLEEMELMGHAVEVAAAVRLYRADRTLQERAEAEALLHPASSYAAKGLFPAKTQEDIEIELGRRREPARRWVEENEERLVVWDAKLKAMRSAAQIGADIGARA